MRCLTRAEFDERACFFVLLFFLLFLAHNLESCLYVLGGVSDIIIVVGLYLRFHHRLPLLFGHKLELCLYVLRCCRSD